MQSFAPEGSAGTAPAIDPKWSDPAFLDALRQQGDPVAEAAVAALKADGVSQATLRRSLGFMRNNGGQLPDDAPEVLQKFFAHTYERCPSCLAPDLPAWVDRDRLIRGQAVFAKHTVACILVLLCKSLPEGYAAPGMTKVLNMSGELTKLPFHRLAGTLQLLKTVTRPGSFERNGMGILATQEMRMLHAGVRVNVAQAAMPAPGYDAYRAQYGIPINAEDLIGVTMAFSLLVIQGLRTLGVVLTPRQEEDYYYVWRVYAHLKGVRAPGMPDDADCLPQSVAEAEVFYQAFAKRHYVGATDYSAGWLERSQTANPDGVGLTKAHMRMIARFLAGRFSDGRGRTTYESDASGPLRRLLQHLYRRLAEMYAHRLIGAEACARVGIGPPMAMRWFHYAVGDWALHTGERLLRKVPVDVRAGLANWWFEDIIKDVFGEPVAYPIPYDKGDLEELATHGRAA
ncbi:MAG: oxygenase MpaB family protein [Gemmatimonadaceae bacterium]